MKQIEKQTIEAESKIRQRIANGEGHHSHKKKRQRAATNTESPIRLPNSVKKPDLDYIANEEIINAEVSNIKKKMDLLKLLEQ